MFKPLFTIPRAFQTRLLLAVALVGCLVWLALTFFRGPAPAANHAVGGKSAPPADITTETAPRKLEGERARIFLEQTGEGQSLMQVLTVARLSQFITEPDASLMRRM